MATIHDIAKMASVSTSTVSHVVNKTRYVSPELAERVEKAIQELDYPPNFVIKKTKNIPAQTSETYILLILSDRKSNFQKQVEHQIEQNLSETNYSLLTFSSVQNIANTKNFFLNLFRLSMVSGVILFPDEQNLVLKDLLLEQKIPVLLLGSSWPDFSADTITSDTLEGSFVATRHLIRNGHEQIAFIGKNTKDQTKRLKGYQKAFEDYNLQCNEEYIFTNLQSEKEIFRTLDDLLSGSQKPTALFLANFSTVMPALKYMHSHNIVCPNDISIVSFNDFDWAPLLTPPITTVEQNIEKIGRITVEKLIERIEKGESANLPALREDYINISLKAKLNVRESTCGIGRGPFGEKAESSNVLSLTEDETSHIRSENFTAAISFHYAGKSWMELHLKGIKKIFDKLNISLIATTDAHFNPALQCKQLDSLKTLEPDILIAMPTDNKLTSSAFRRIAESRTKLIFISNVPDELKPDDYVTCVSVNERSHGRNMGHGLGQYMLRYELSKLGLITHDANFYATRQRDAAAEQVIAEEYSDLYICGNMKFHTEEDIYDKTIAFITRYPEIGALYVSWDGPALKVIAALTTLGRTDIAIVTGDLDYEDAFIMAKGGMIKMISAQCPYEQGQAIATAAACALINKSTPSFIGIEPIRVTPENLLKSWKRIFQEEPGNDLKNAFSSNPNYITTKDY